MIPALLVAAAVFIWVVVVYNGFVKLQQRSHQAFADIDAQLKRRHDLVPALVETVKGYAGHEKKTLQEVVARRTAAAALEGGTDPGTDRLHVENVLAQAMRGVFALAEAYPDLKANERFAGLQDELAEIENGLQHARRYYNAVVRDLNTALARFPALIVARGLGFSRRDFFEVDSPLERAAAAVELGASVAAER